MLRESLIFLVAIICMVEGCKYRNRECPNYIVQEKHADYEIRKYPALTWATASAEHHYIKIAQSRAFTILFGYITGKNSLKMNMDMTVPVKMNATYKGETTVYRMSFMMPSEHAEHLPIPDDANIVITHEPSTVYAVRTFPGNVWRQATWIEQAKHLENSLKDDDTIDKTWYYQVGYDAPEIQDKRRNEIWMMKNIEQ